MTALCSLRADLLNPWVWSAIAVTSLLAPVAAFTRADELDLAEAVVVVRPGGLPNAERTAATVLVEETEKRTGVRWNILSAMPRSGTAISLTSLPDAADSDLRPEGYHLRVDTGVAGLTVVRVVGADPRGALFGVGKLLRSMNWARGSVKVPRSLDVKSSPAYPLRGHQLCYGNTANSYDAWDVDKYEQYIRELVIFGSNSLENSPFQREESSRHFPIPPSEMSLRLSEICNRYDVDYWVFTPATFDLGDTEKRAAELERHEAFYRVTPRLDGVFVPGGDPGDNHPRLLLPFVRDMAERLARYHPETTVWISLQAFNEEETDYFFHYVEENSPGWLTGIATGPQSPLISEERRRLPAKYRVRHYPDITHTVRCQYQVPWWDPAFAFTLGREPENPQPVYYALIHNAFAPYTDGFLAYSEGAHDDVNKVIWSARGWDPGADVRDILVEYARFFFGPDVAEDAADGILALERNWEGPLTLNGGVDGTFALWQRLERQRPELATNWRWQMLLLRAYYDMYTRHRLLYETALEDEANQTLVAARTVGANSAMDATLAILSRATTEPVRRDLRTRIDQLCAALFQSIGFQTSVERYGASGSERGAVLDFVDHPLNNRWWLEDEFARIRMFPTEAEKLARLELIRTWETPGPGSFYDDIGNVAKSPHIIRGEGLNTDPLMQRNPNPGFWSWDGGYSRKRPSWMSSMWPGHHQSGWPIALVYEHVDPAADYTVRMTGIGDAILRANGARLTPTVYERELGQFKEYPVPRELYRGGKITLTFDSIPEEKEVNWRNRSRVTEVWLLKR